MKFSIVSGALALAAVVHAGGSMSSCSCKEIVEWETETVYVTVAPGYQTPSSCAIATVTPTSCSSCGYTLVGTLPQYVQTEICTTVTCDDGKLLPTTWTTGSTCMVNTMCTVDKDGKTHGLDPITKTVTACDFSAPTLLPSGCAYETCEIPQWVIDADGHKQTVPPCTVTYTWYPGPSYYPKTYPWTSTGWNNGSPVISIINNISINIITPTGQVWAPGKGGSSSKSGYPSGGARPTGPGPHSSYHPSPSGAPGNGNQGGSGPGNQGGNGLGNSNNGTNSGNNTTGADYFLLASSDGTVGIMQNGRIVFVAANSSAAQSSSGFTLNNGGLFYGNGIVAQVDDSAIQSSSSEVFFTSALSRMLFRRADNTTSTQNASLTWDIDAAGDLEAFYGDALCYFLVCPPSNALRLSLTPGNGTCTAITLTEQPISSDSTPSGSSNTNSGTSTSASDSSTSATGTSASTTGTNTSITDTSTSGTDSTTGSTSPAPTTSTSTSASTTSNSASTTSPTGSVVSGTPTDFQEQMVYWHNVYRARHGSTPVIWNDTLAAYAQNYSTYCSSGHSNSEFYGENLAYGGYTNPSYYIYLWYNEISNYDYNDPVFGLNTGHFTQVVWNASVQIGCGWVYNGCMSSLGNSYPNYLACEYYPYGNVDGEFATEVPPLVSGASSTIPQPPGDLS